MAGPPGKNQVSQKRILSSLRLSAMEIKYPLQQLYTNLHGQAHLEHFHLLLLFQFYVLLFRNEALFMIYHKYLVKEGDAFEAHQFPQVVDDLTAIRLAMAKAPDSFTAETLLSFCKDPERGSANPEPANQLHAETLPLTNLKALFRSSSHNPMFQQTLEDYIRTSLSEQLSF